MKTHLKLEIQNDLKNFIEELRRIKACWINYVKEKTAKSVSSKTHQTLEDILNSKKCLSPDDEKELKDIADGVKNALTVECITNVPTAEEWLRKLRLTLGMLDQSAQKLIQSFKRATVIFFNRFFEELKCVYETLTEMDEDEVSSIQCEMYTPTIEEMRDIYNNKLDLVQQIWNDLIKDMSKTVDHTYKFLIAGSTLFEKHFRRLTVLQLMVQKDISNVIIGNNRVLEMYGLKLNVLLDTLRQEPTEDKVNKTFEEIKKHLNSMDELCRTQFQAETTTTKKYTTYLDQALDILIAELNRFLVIYPPDMEKDPKIQRKRASRTSEMADPNEDLIPNQIWYCKFEVDAVTNWGFGLWESIRTYVQTAKSELQKDGEKWINDEIQTLEHRLEIRLNITKIKYAKIQAYIYEERLKELDIHKSRLEEHKRAIEKTLQAIKDQFNQHQEQYTQIFEQYNREIQKLESRCLNVQGSSTVTAYITVLHAKLENGKEECENVYSKYVKEVGRIFNEIKSKNIMFIKHMRLFSENGNFNPLESKEYIKHLTKLEGQCEKDISSIEKTSQTAKTSIMTDMETRHSEVMDTLKTIREEYLFAEKVEKKLQCLRKDVDKKLDSEKSNFNDLSIAIKHLEEDAKSGCGNFKYFDVFDLISNEISQKAESLALYLDHPVPLILYSDKSNIETNDTKLQTKKIEDHISTYHAKLFNFSLESQRATFLTDLHIIILNCWNDLSEQAKVFYEDRHRFFLSESKYHSNPDSFFQNLYQTFLSYQNDFEATWMINVKLFINLLNKFIPFYEDYVDVYLSEYHRKTLKAFDTWYDDNVKKPIKHQKEQVRNVFMEVQKKLKPLHGHPRNKQLLDNLEAEAELTCIKAAELTKDSKANYLKYLEDYFDEAVYQFYSLKDSLPNYIQRFSSIQDRKNELNRKVLEKMVLLRSYINWLVMTTGKDRNVVVTCKNFLNLYDNKTESSDSHHGSRYTSKRSASTITSEWDEGSILNFADTVEFIRDIRQTFEKRCLEINMEDFEDLISALKKEWQHAVDKVLSLYTVKYDATE
ncbi:uncharacterized protein LOC143195271 isoform X2 [Rhynchophorus ferrugineus]|uniref:uncharacterized protein LOC143195271 isoform X2 n=1 Tax=Rhynchophorus ferrugineus TaxID=354439 RepID=UPI003FCED7AA